MPTKFHSAIPYLLGLASFLNTVKNKCNKWKYHFEMNREVGMADRDKGKKQGVSYPIPTSLFSQMQHLTHSWMNQVRKMGMGMHPSVSFLFHDLPSLHPSSFQANDISTCVLNASDITSININACL